MTTYNNNFRVKNGLEVAETVTAVSMNLSSSTYFVNGQAVTVDGSNISLNGTPVGGGGQTQLTVTATTVLSTAQSVLVLVTGSGGYTITLPQVTGAAYNQEFAVKNSTSGSVTVNTSNSEQIDTTSTLVMEFPNSSVTFKSTVDSWKIF